ncbi:MAG: hypothetical protein ABI581_02980 [Sediminibacterium sp.]
MEKRLPQQPRRNFIRQAATAALSFSVLPSIAGAFKLRGPADKKPPLAPEMVNEFVRVAHFDLARVKEMLQKEPSLVNACWDWGGGDFEVAVGGPAHIGNRDIVNYLLDNGSRKDIYCSAMLGDKELVEAFIKTHPAIADTRGPHQFSLMYHVAISGDTDLAAKVLQHVTHIAKDCNQALHSAVKNDKVLMAEWLLTHGVDNTGTTDFAGNTPVQVAEKKDNKQMVILLKKYAVKS